MTREEVVAKFNALQAREKPIGAAEYMTDWLLALGILKLDEPPSINDRAAKAMWIGASIDGMTAYNALEALDAAGLKIVEK